MTQQLFFKSTTNAYYLTGTPGSYTVTAVTDPDYPATTVRGCAYLDGRFVVMTSAGVIQHSALQDAATWSALDFIQSQIDSSAGVYLAKLQNYIVAFKDWGIEFFYDAANPTGSILAPVQNAAIPIGCASGGSVQELPGTIIFMGHSRVGQGRSIYVLSGTTPEKVSTPQVEKVLNRDDLATVNSWSAVVGAHTLYGITLGTSAVTLVYDLTYKMWSVFTYLLTSGVNRTITAITTGGVATSTTHGYGDGDIVLVASTNASFNGWHATTDVTTNTFQLQATGTVFSGSGTATKYTETFFPIVSSVRSGGHQYAQDATNGGLYELSATAYVDVVGAIAARVRTSQIDNQTVNNKTISSVYLVGDKIASIALVRCTDDDYATYSAYRPVDLSITRSGIRRLGDFRRRAFEVLHVKNANLRLEALEINVGGQ